MHEDDSSRPPAPARPPSPEKVRRDAPARTTSQTLFGAARELIIEHDGREYHLRVTQQGKLILTA